MTTRSPLRISIVALAAALICSGGVVLDRIAVIVGTHVIKTSEIDRDLRTVEFLNGEPLNFSPEAKRKSADRLVDQEVIREAIFRGGYRHPTEADGEAYEKQLIHDRFHDSQAEFSKALASYGLTEPRLRTHLLWQLTVLQFIDERFRQEAAASNEKAPDAAQANQNFTAWLDEARKREQIVYEPEAFK